MFNNNINIVSAIVSSTKTDCFKYKKQNSNYKKGKTFSSIQQNEDTKNTSEENTIIKTIEKVELDLQNTLDLSSSLMKTQRAFLYK